MTMTHAGQLRPPLPSPGSQMRPEPFQIELKVFMTRTFQDKAPVNFDTRVLGVTEKAKQEFERCSMGQKRRRSAAQRARRQRELAEQIEELLQAKGRKNIRSRAQTLRRKVEEAERRLELNAVCALNNEFEMNNPRRESSYRPSRREQMLGSGEYHRLLSVAKQSEQEHRQREENVGREEPTKGWRRVAPSNLTCLQINVNLYLRQSTQGLQFAHKAAKSQPEVDNERRLKG
ncbi:hypothetical protein DFH09DRAFT_1106472 [Mycena vulgaris]|nr:hypothetical protein DFH09DRAFT_1106472 [Mycena vulgaris]